MNVLKVEIEGQVHKIPTASGAKSRNYTKEQAEECAKIFQKAIESGKLSKNQEKRFRTELGKYGRIIPKLRSEPKTEEEQVSSIWSYLNPWAYF